MTAALPGTPAAVRDRKSRPRVIASEFISTAAAPERFLSSESASVLSSGSGRGDVRVRDGPLTSDLSSII